MIATILTILCGVGGYAAAGNGEWGTVALCVVIVAGAWLFHALSVADAKAYVNCRNYWARGGPEQYRRHQSGR